MRLMIIGHGRHGKDTVGNRIAWRLGLRSQCSSRYAAREAIYKRRYELFSEDYLTGDLIKDGPDAKEEDVVERLYADRASHRETWKAAICDFNKDDKARLARGLYSEADIYVGLRSRDEFLAARPLFDLAIWVDACERLPLEETLEVTADDCDIIITNNGPEQALWMKVDRLCRTLHTFALDRIQPVRRSVEALNIITQGACQ